MIGPLGLVLTLLLAATGPQPFASTPEGAALAAVYAQTLPIRVVRVNRAGRFATVLLRNAFIEGNPENAAILVERFSNGWQALESLNFGCRLRDHRLGRTSEAILLRGMPVPKDEDTCGSGRGSTDSGPQVDIETLRRMKQEPFLAAVIVRGDYAIYDWYGAGGGQAVFHRTNSSWHLLLGGGGAPDSQLLLEKGVPAAYLCPFGISDATCP